MRDYNGSDKISVAADHTAKKKEKKDKVDGKIDGHPFLSRRQCQIEKLVLDREDGSVIDWCYNVELRLLKINTIQCRRKLEMSGSSLRFDIELKLGSQCRSEIQCAGGNWK
ncbi:uncharacterized protein MEPE_04740 [Melanopsichium pennsylvanicum]|uniref:Uncharacterized protein n=1 Tax=Melanopsichium pennsylvanicum TaxID=63383 RepID=A0AAJ4XQD5_9BASI|nr:uncharacterized protein MEPE_04740 [Melanopsichium pennsylvanicum]